MASPDSFDAAEATAARSRIELTDTVSTALGLSPTPVAVAAWVHREGYRTSKRAPDERSQRVYAEAVVASVLLDTPGGKIPAASRISAALADAGFGRESQPGPVSVSPVADPGDRSYYLDGECLDYAVALSRKHSLRIAVVWYGDREDEFTSRHVYAHDDRYAYDANGVHDLDEVIGAAGVEYDHDLDEESAAEAVYDVIEEADVAEALDVIEKNR